MRLAWLTDLHLEFLHPPGKIEQFCRSIAQKRPDGVLIGGDTGTAVDPARISHRIARS
jgi:hypothetical protein